jgi:hypothetical protein
LDQVLPIAILLKEDREKAAILWRFRKVTIRKVAPWIAGGLLVA